MKLWKKILIGVVVLAAVAIGLVGYGIFKIGTAYTEKIEPDMKRYAQMTVEDQNRYVSDHLDDFMGMLSQKSGDPQGQDKLEAMRRDHALRQATIEWGRSLCAAIIDASEDIGASLTPAQKAQYKKEAATLEERGNRLKALMEKYSDKAK